MGRGSIAVALILSACNGTGAGGGPTDAGPGDTVGALDATDDGGAEAGGGDAGAGDGDAGVADGGAAGDAGGRDFSAIEAILMQRSAAAGVTRLGLTIWDARDQKVYEHMLGDFTPDTRVAVASASKLVSGLVVLDVIRRGLLSLDATTGQVLGWTGPNAAITVRHLLSFTSGLPPDAPCRLNATITLADCAATLATTAAVAPPGTRFDYGSSHLLVAAAMAQQATGALWADQFAQTLRGPLGLPGDVAYFTAPRQSLGLMNPLIAGGLRASINDYHHFLAIEFHEGSYGTLTIGTPELFDQQAKEPFPDAVIGNTPLPALRYGLTSWLECATPATGCQVLSSPGAFGFTPWLDREAQYYAILGMELDATGSDEGVVQFAISLQQELKPLIVAEMAK
jgi:CubicO group peptidase (beta-lactamase class C family)